MEVSGVLPKNSPTCSRTYGTRVEPPTITTACTSSDSTLASFKARRQVNNERFTSE